MTTKVDKLKWTQNLKRLRGPGQRRAAKKRPSAALLALMEHLPKEAMILDIGCGESGDVDIARRYGHTAFALDLLPPSGDKYFVQANATSLPFVSESVDGILSHAMVALLSQSERSEMYWEIARVLKPQGLFSLTVYPLSDGFDVKASIERQRLNESGLHYHSAGVYVKCSDADCKQHPNPDTFEAIVHGVRQIDSDERFVKTASLFITWVFKGGSPNEAAEFAGVDKTEIFDLVIKPAITCGIFDEKEGTLELPWLTDFTEDRVFEGEVNLMLDTLCLMGDIRRLRNEQGEVLYGAPSNDEQGEGRE